MKQIMDIDGQKVFVEIGHAALLSALSELWGAAVLLDAVESGEIGAPHKVVDEGKLNTFSYLAPDGSKVTRPLA